MSYVKSTTILGLYSESTRTAVVASDGQATLDNMIIKKHTKKVYRLHEDSVLVGFAGATADCLSLLDKFEGKLKKYDGQLRRSAVELTKEWRTDRILRHLEAVIVAVSKEGLLMISGVGDVLEPDGGVIGIGSGGPYALAAAKGLLSASEAMPPTQIARRALEIAAEIDIYTNDQITLEEIHW
ncbi:ATP-dependent protease subunit HslV [Candidatus Bipolaricaulota bacterium]|jgi:ATP-dependent HslUV protease subunit HslV|nr:ATP-dependent protease subunit HslV [Candidatus Bipolaricaulota bacterium]TFH10754.1 MAG: ATP-dependent protease subunit HslV [Candidatus Atribacteria bacterium]